MAKSKQTRQFHSPLANVAPEVVDPRWLLKALGLVIAIAAVLGYLTLCLLIYQGAWQLLLHPSPTVDRTPAALAIPFMPVRFDAAATGHPRLSAWWIPAEAADAPTLLYLHDGKGSLASTVDQLALLHRAGVNLFAIDYRGFGASDPIRPNEARMTADANAALEYLIDTRHLVPGTIVPYGVGLGAALAAALTAGHPQIQAVIIDNPDPEAASRVIHDNRSRMIPVRLLLRDRFDVATPLRQLQRPKLLLAGGGEDTHPAHDREVSAFFKSLPDPKFIVTLPPIGSHGSQQDQLIPSRGAEDEQSINAVRRFLDDAFASSAKK